MAASDVLEKNICPHPQDAFTGPEYIIWSTIQVHVDI
jgi:hypothetical protein